MEHLSQIGTIVYLELDLPALSRRLGNLKKRGVVLKNGQTLKDLYNERTPLYKKYADIIIPRGGENTTGIHILQEHLKLMLD